MEIEPSVRSLHASTLFVVKVEEDLISRTSMKIEKCTCVVMWNC